MTINFLFFASLAEAAKTDRAQLSMPDNTTVGDALSVLFEAYPALKPMRAGLATAVNHEYVDSRYCLKDGDELALIPPVSGG